MAFLFFLEKQLRIIAWKSSFECKPNFLREIKPTKLAKLLNQAKTSLVTPWFYGFPQ